MLNFVLILPLLVLLPLSLFIIVGYLFFYRSKINQQLHAPSSSRHKPLWSPLRVCLTTVISALVVYAAVCLVMTNPNLPPLNPHHSLSSDYSCRILTQEEMQEGYRSLFSMEENPGYAKEVTELEDVRYTYFLSETELDLFHPVFLVYAEYIGDGTPAYQDATITYYDPEGVPETMAASGMDSSDRVICFFGSAFSGGTISCTVAFHDTLPEEFNLEALQAEHTPLEFTLPSAY